MKRISLGEGWFFADSRQPIMPQPNSSWAWMWRRTKIDMFVLICKDDVSGKPFMMISQSLLTLFSIFLLNFLQITFPCPPTSTTAPPVVTTTTPTTTSTTTSTTTTTTTTTTTNPCAQCTLATITLTRGDGTTTGTPTTPGVQCCDANGCSSLTVTCTALPGGLTFMQFNINQGGPINPIGTIVMATLNCNAQGQWVYAPGGGLPSRVITEVNCVLTGGG